MLGKFINLFFEEEEVEIEEETEVEVPKKTISQTVVTEEKKEDVKKMVNITVDDGFSSVVSEPKPLENIEKVRVNQSVFIQNEARPVTLKSIGGKAVEYEFTPVMSPIFGVVGGEKRSITVFPNMKKTEILQPKESILGAGIRPYAGIVEKDQEAEIPFDIRNGNKRSLNQSIEKIELEEIVQPVTRMERHTTVAPVIEEETPFVFTEEDYQSFEENVQSHLSSLDQYTEMVNTYDDFSQPINTEVPSFDESAIVVKEKPSFFQHDNSNDYENKGESIQTLDDEDTLAFEEEEDLNLFNMDME